MTPAFGPCPLDRPRSLGPFIISRHERQLNPEGGIVACLSKGEENTSDLRADCTMFIYGHSSRAGGQRNFKQLRVCRFYYPVWLHGE